MTSDQEQSDALIWMDGEYIPIHSATTHVLSHSLSYGTAAFEGVRSYGGRVFLGLDHAERLARSCRALGYELPYDHGQVVDAMQGIADRGGNSDAYIRPVAWRGGQGGGLGVAGELTAHLAIAAWPWPEYYSPEARRQGLNLAISRWRRPCPLSAPGDVKAAGLYMTNTIARAEARASGYDDALMLDYQGGLGEATGANLFLVIEGRIHTPKAEGILRGITRGIVIELARERGILSIERPIDPAELVNASEVFLTGTAVEVIAVRRVGELSFNIGPVACSLARDYDAFARGGRRRSAVRAEPRETGAFRS